MVIDAIEYTRCPHGWPITQTVTGKNQRINALTRGVLRARGHQKELALLDVAFLTVLHIVITGWHMGCADLLIATNATLFHQGWRITQRSTGQRDLE